MAQRILPRPDFGDNLDLAFDRWNPAALGALPPPLPIRKISRPRATCAAPRMPTRHGSWQRSPPRRCHGQIQIQGLQRVA